MIVVRSRGVEGLLQLHDTSGHYEIPMVSFVCGGSNYEITLRCRPSYPQVIKIQEGAVNNLGDIHWKETFKQKVEAVETQSGRTTIGDTEE